MYSLTELGLNDARPAASTSETVHRSRLPEGALRRNVDGSSSGQPLEVCARATNEEVLVWSGRAHDTISMYVYLVGRPDLKGRRKKSRTSTPLQKQQKMAERLQNPPIQLTRWRNMSYSRVLYCMVLCVLFDLTYTHSHQNQRRASKPGVNSLDVYSDIPESVRRRSWSPGHTRAHSSWILQGTATRLL